MKREVVVQDLRHNLARPQRHVRISSDRVLLGLFLSKFVVATCSSSPKCCCGRGDGDHTLCAAGVQVAALSKLRPSLLQRAGRRVNARYGFWPAARKLNAEQRKRPSRLAWRSSSSQRSVSCSETMPALTASLAALANSKFRSARSKSVISPTAASSVISTKPCCVSKARNLRPTRG